MEDYKLVREYRKRAGLTQAKLAELIGLKMDSLYKIEAGMRVASKGTLQRIAVALRAAGHPFPPEFEGFLGVETPVCGCVGAVCPAAPGGAANERGAEG